MKKIAQTLVAVCALLVVGASSGLAMTISSVTASIVPTPALLLQPKESLTYTLTGTFTGTAVLERSFDGTNYEIVLSSVNNSNATKTGKVFSDDRTTYYRWRGSTITAGSFGFKLQDDDNFVSEVKNRKGDQLIQYNDESVITRGDANQYGTFQSTDTTSGNSSGRTFKAYLAGTSAAIEGSLLVATTPVAGTGPILSQGVSVIVAPATVDLTNWVGVAKAPASTGTIVDVYYSGTVLALSTGTVVAGDTLVSSNTASGYLGADSSPTTGADVGVALSGGTSTGGRIKVRLR